MMKTSDRIDKDKDRGLWIFGLLVIAYVSAFFLPYLFTGTTSLLPSYQDESQWLLYQTFINQSYGQGFFPLWTPDLNCGMPFLGWSHSAAMYPINVIYAIFDYANATWINQWIHSLIYSLGLFFLCRKLGASNFSSFLAVVIGGAIFISGSLGNFLPNIRTGSYIPLLFISILGLLYERRFIYFVLFLLTNLLMYLGGQVELIGLAYEVVAVVLIAWGLKNLKEPKKVTSVYLLFAFSFLLAYIVTQVQSLPTLELTDYSIRGEGISFEYFKIWSGMKNLKVWLPYVISGVALVPFIYAIFSIRRLPVLLFLFIGLIYCIFLIHDLFGVLWLVYQIPLLKDLLAHSRIIFCARILVMVMVALGIDGILESDRRRYWLYATAFVSMFVFALWMWIPENVVRNIAAIAEPNMRNVVLRLLDAMDYCLPIAFIISFPLFFSSRLESRWKHFPIAVLILLATTVYAVPWLFAMPQKTGDVFDFPEEYIKFMDSNKGLHRTQTVYAWKKWEDIGIPLQAGILNETRSMGGYITVTVDRYTRFWGALVPATFREKEGKISDLEATRVLKEGVFIEDRTIPWLNFMGLRYIAAEQRNLKFADHYFLAYPDSVFLTNKNNARVERSYGKNISDRLIFNGRVCGKLHVQPKDHLNFRLPEESEGNWNVLRLSATGPQSERIVYARYADKGGVQASQVPLSSQSQVVDACFESFTIPGKPRQNVISDPVITNRSKYFKRIPLPTSRLSIFENSQAMPPAILASRVTVSPKSRALELIKKNRLNPRHEAVVEGQVPYLPRLALQQGEGARVKRHNAMEVHIETSTLVKRLLVLSDAYFPGWKAFVDGEEKPALPTNYAFRGVVVPSGKHDVIMSYQPVSFRIGLWVTISTLGALVIVVILRLRMK